MKSEEVIKEKQEIQPAYQNRHNKKLKVYRGKLMSYPWRITAFEYGIEKVEPIKTQNGEVKYKYYYSPKKHKIAWFFKNEKIARWFYDFLEKDSYKPPEERTQLRLEKNDYNDDIDKNIDIGIGSYLFGGID